MFPATGNNSDPWLVYPRSWQTGDQTLCRISSSGPVCRKFLNVPQLQNKEVIYCSTDGKRLLLFHHTEINDDGGDWRLSIWNPITDESIELPLCERPQGVLFYSIDKVQALISSSPSDLILLFFKDCPLVFFCRVGDEKWCSFDYAQYINGKESFPPPCEFRLHKHRCGQLQQPVSIGGKVYALHSCCNNLIRIDVNDSNHCLLEVMPKPQLVLSGTLRSYLVPSGDHELYLVMIIFPITHDFRCREAPEIQVQRFDLHGDCWEMVTSLSGGAIFLGNGYSFSRKPMLSSSSNDDDNKWSFIHFTSALSQMLFSYRMEDESLTTYAPCLTNPPGVWLWLPYWIMPFHSEQPLDLETASKQVDDDGDGDFNEGGALQVDGDGNFDEGGAQEVDGDDESMMHCLKKRKMMVDGVKESVGTSLCDLSSELIGLIAENLPSVVDYLHFLHLSRGENDLVRTRKKPFQTCLIFRDRVNGKYHITDCNLSRKLSVEIPQALINANIGCSRDGWILLRGQSSYHFFNPLTLQTSETDCNAASNGIMNLTYIGKPWQGGRKNGCVFEMSAFHPREESSLHLEPGKEESRPLKVENFFPSCNSPVFSKECFYYFESIGRLLGCLRWSEREWKVEVARSPCSNYTRSYLTECGGELVAVFIRDVVGRMTKNSRVIVFKLNDDHKKWEEIDCLDGHCLYVGWPSSMSCLAEKPEMADRIYFPRFYKDGLVYYSLKTNKYHSTWNDEEELKSFHRTTLYSDSAWFQPNWS